MMLIAWENVTVVSTAQIICFLYDEPIMQYFNNQATKQSQRALTQWDMRKPGCVPEVVVWLGTREPDHEDRLVLPPKPLVSIF